MSNVPNWTKESIRTLLETNNTMLSRSIVKLYEYQTHDEKSLGAATEHNGMGFNSIDAEFLTSLAERIIDGRTLTERQIMYGRKKMLKYSKQLARIANQGG